MPRKGMRSILFHPKEPSFAISDRRSSIPASPSLSTIDRTIEAASLIFTKWNPDDSTYAKVTSLFYEDKREATQYMKCVADLQKAMHLLVSHDSTDQRLVRSQHLMQMAMKRLQKEFYQLLSMNRAYLDPESVSSRASTRSSTSSFDDAVDEFEDASVRGAGDSISQVEAVASTIMSDLKSIAECMISAGYTKECIAIYKTIRKSIIDEAIYKLGVEKLTASQVNKMEWESLEIRIKNWLEALKVSMRTLFTGERILCDQVFAVSNSIRDSCFTHISKEAALLLFGFPELLISKGGKIKKSSFSSSSSSSSSFSFSSSSSSYNNNNDRVFRLLDMYSVIAQNWGEIEFIFSFESTSVVQSQALTSLIKLSESIRSTIAELESNIRKYSSNTLPSRGGGVHPLTNHMMNYLTTLGDYSNFLADILSDSPPPPEVVSLPESYFDIAALETEGVISVRFAWLILVLLRKIEVKAKKFKDESLSNLFLANNLQHVVFKIRTSNLQYLLGENWIAKHENKVRQFAGSFEQLAWGPVISSLEDAISDNPTAATSPVERFKRFNASFEEAYRKQSSCVVADPKLRDEIKISIERKIARVYHEFYEKHGADTAVGNGGQSRNSRLSVRYTPQDVENFLSDLYFGTVDSEGSSLHSTSSPSPSHRRRRFRLGF